MKNNVRMQFQEHVETAKNKLCVHYMKGACKVSGFKHDCPFSPARDPCKANDPDEHDTNKDDSHTANRKKWYNVFRPAGNNMYAHKPGILIMTPGEIYCEVTHDVTPNSFHPGLPQFAFITMRRFRLDKKWDDHWRIAKEVLEEIANSAGTLTTYDYRILPDRKDARFNRMLLQLGVSTSQAR